MSEKKGIEWVVRDGDDCSLPRLSGPLAGVYRATNEYMWSLKILSDILSHLEEMREDSEFQHLNETERSPNFARWGGVWEFDIRVTPFARGVFKIKRGMTFIVIPHWEAVFVEEEGFLLYRTYRKPRAYYFARVCDKFEDWLRIASNAERTADIPEFPCWPRPGKEVQ